MTKVGKVFQVFFFISVFIFFIELTMIFSQIDIVPFIAIGVLGGLTIFLRNSSDDFFNAENNYKDSKLIIKFILLTILNILIFSIFILLGIENIALFILNLLHSVKIIRFILYGLLFPVVISYLLTWFWTDNKPNLSILYAIVMPNSVGAFYRLLFFNLFIGAFVCIFWDNYYSIVDGLLRFF